MADAAEFGNILQTLQKSNQENSEQINKQTQHTEQSNLLLSKTSGGIEKLLMSTQTRELGTGKYDEQMHQALLNLHKDYESHAPLDPHKHEQLLFEIREGLQANQQTLLEKFERFFTNNVTAFTKFDTGLQRILGVDIFEKERADKKEALEKRSRFVEEEEYELSFLQYKLLSTDIIDELRSQTDALETLVRRTPSRREREENEMEAARQRERGLIAQKSFVKGPNVTDNPSIVESLLNNAGTVAGAVGGVLGFKALKNLVKTRQAAQATAITKTSLAMSDEAIKTVAPLTDDAAKAGSKLKFTAAADDIIKTSKGLAKTGLGIVGKTVLGVFSGVSASIATGKDIFDIVSAVSDDDIRTSVKYEDIGAVAGSIVGGSIGFVFGGPAGAALGADLGNTIGEKVGRIFDDPDVSKNVDETLETMQERVDAAVGQAKVREQEKLDKFKKAIEAETLALETTNKKMDQKIEEIEILKDQKKALQEDGDVYNAALAEAEIIRKQAEQLKLNIVRKEQENELKRALRMTFTKEGVEAAGETGFFEKMAYGDGPLAGIFKLFADEGPLAETEAAILQLADIEENVEEQTKRRIKVQTEQIKRKSENLRERLSDEEITQKDFDIEQQKLLKQIEELGKTGTIEEQARANIEYLSQRQRRRGIKSGLALNAQRQLEELLRLQDEIRTAKEQFNNITTIREGDTIDSSSRRSSTIITGGSPQDDRLIAGQSLVQ